MARQYEIDLHAARARDELARAREARCEAAAFAHLALSELHLAAMRALSETPGPPKFLRLVASNPAAPGARVTGPRPAKSGWNGK
jgi:hypothetical protein